MSKVEIAKKKKWVDLSKGFSGNKDSKYSDIIVKILFNRGIIGLKDLEDSKILDKKIESFLYPDYNKELLDPFLLTDMKKAVKRIITALEKKEKIVVYGDYDVDGTTSSALLHDVFTRLKADFEVYIPSRQDEGYGLNKEAIDELKKKKNKLIITVDCGIRSFEEIEHANSSGIDVIVTDHHEVLQETIINKQSAKNNGGDSLDKLPKALAVINPKRSDSKYPFRDLAGVGVAFKLVQALFEELDRKGDLEKKYDLKKEYTKWLLDLVALGTVCDIVPLMGENRLLTHYGLKVFRKTKREGLKALLHSAGAVPNEVNTHRVGYHLGPRLNAAGRLEHANISLMLLVTDDQNEALKGARKLTELNLERQELTDRILEEARGMLKGKEKDKILLLKNKNWPQGVVGIVASKLVDQCGKPVIVFEEGEDESNGSARSIKNFDIVKALEKCEDLLVRYGGHKKAAGLRVKNEHFIVLNEKLIKIANDEIFEKDLIPEIKVDTKIILSDISDGLYSNILKMEPFGYGNSAPVFMIENLEIVESRKVGKEKNHLKLTLSDGIKKIGGIQFSFDEDVNVEDKVSIVASIIENEWNGMKKLELRVMDIRKT